MKIMKTMKRLFCMLLLAAAATAFIACSDKEDDNPINPNSGELVYGQWVERGNQLIYSESYDQGYGMGYTMTWTLTFDSSEICIASECTYTFASADLAQIVYESYADEEVNARISGRVVTFDFTEYHAGLTKAEAMAMVESMGGLM